jgi:hypothetical protein
MINTIAHSDSQSESEDDRDNDSEISRSRRKGPRSAVRKVTPAPSIKDKGRMSQRCLDKSWELKKVHKLVGPTGGGPGKMSSLPKRGVKQGIKDEPMDVGWK